MNSIVCCKFNVSIIKSLSKSNSFNIMKKCNTTSKQMVKLGPISCITTDLRLILALI